MKITFKLYAGLSRYLPEDAKNHTLTLDVESDRLSPYEVLDMYQVPHERAFLLLINGVYLQPGQRDKAVLKEGDTLAVWPPVAGG